MTFEFDRWAGDKPYPNLARWQARPYTPEWRQFSRHWPYSEPPMLLEYMADEGVTWEGKPLYLVAVSYFDFGVNWPGLIPLEQMARMRLGQLSFVLYYSEGDNPSRIREHLLGQFSQQGVSSNCVHLISANSAAAQLPGCSWFADDELLFRKRNRACEPIMAHNRARSHLFVALVRTHKWWRATVMADIWRRGWHQMGYFGYNPDITVGDCATDNPIEIDQFPGLRDSVQQFLQHKHQADDLTSDQHNDHHLVVPDHFSNAYLNIVIETHMDVDQSGGTFLTEKTFKPIKNAQPFVIFGAAGSLTRLRDLGYRTFDHAIDSSYDSIENTTERYAKLMQILEHLIDQGHSGMHSMYQACIPDVTHNQRHFLAPRKSRLNKLLEQI